MNVRESIDLKVHLAFDEEAEVWYVAASDIPGLRLEAADPMDLVRRISESAAELIELNEDEVLRKRAKKEPAYRPVYSSFRQLSAGSCVRLIDGWLHERREASTS